jgi:hypothetical protein
MIEGSSHISVVGTRVAQLALYKMAMISTDVTLRAWLPLVVNEIVQSLDITTACIPHIKRFLESLKSGMIRVEDPVDERSGLELQATINSSNSGRSTKLDSEWNLPNGWRILVRFSNSQLINLYCE